MLKCPLGVRNTLLICCQGIFDLLQVLVWVPNKDALKTFNLPSTSRGGLKFGSFPFYIFKEGEVIGLMAHHLLLLIINTMIRLKKMIKTSKVISSILMS